MSHGFHLKKWNPEVRSIRNVSLVSTVGQYEVFALFLLFHFLFMLETSVKI